MPEFVTVTGPAFAASYLVNGDASGISEADKAAVDAWLRRNGIRVLDVTRDEAGECEEAHFTGNFGLHFPEGDASGGDVLDYVARCI